MAPATPMVAVACFIWCRA